MKHQDPEPGKPPQHYFSEQPTVPSAPRTAKVSVRGLDLEFVTDAGVFSHGAIDRGSKVLVAEVQVRPGARVLDWGAGYGFLGITLALLYPQGRVTMVEINQRAAALTEQNVARYQLRNTEVICGPAPEAIGEQRFDVVVSNPPLHVGRAAVEAVIRDAAQRLTPGGELWVVIPTAKGAKRYLALMDELFAQTRTVSISGGFRVLWARTAETETDSLGVNDNG